MASCRALALRSLLLPDPLNHLNLRAAASAPAAARSTPPRRRRRRHLRCCSSSGRGGGGDPGQPPQEAVLEAISKVARSKGRVALTTNMVLGGTVADDSGDEWLVLDQKVCFITRLVLFVATVQCRRQPHSMRALEIYGKLFCAHILSSKCSFWKLEILVNSYPTDRGFTAIGTGGDDFVQSMVVAVESVLQEPIPKGQVSQKLSSRGKYVSVKIGPIRVVSSEQVQAVYRAMRRDNRMKYFL